ASLPRDRGRHGARRDPCERAVRHHARRKPRAAAPPFRAHGALDPRPPALSAPIWTADAAALAATARALAAAPEVSLDTEGDSLHHYPERLSLVQLAAADVRHLFALKERLTQELSARGRLGGVEEECAALAAQIVPERVVDPDAYLGVKGARELSPRGLAILRELWALRESLARAADR